MKKVFGILALMVIASIMIAGCVQPAGNETVTPGATPGLTETPAGTVTTPIETETPAGTVTTPIETETPAGTVTTPVGGETPTTTSAANVTETPPAPPAAAVADEIVSITDSGFSPSSITVPTGTTVGWINEGTVNQTVTATTDSTGFFDSGLLQPGNSFAHNFRATGNYTYTSQTSGATGEVIVVPSTAS